MQSIVLLDIKVLNFVSSIFVLSLIIYQTFEFEMLLILYMVLD